MGNKGAARPAKARERKGAVAAPDRTSATIVHTAAQVLEEEIAAGFKAAQHLSTDVETPSGRNSNPAPTSFLEIIDRFERRGQQAVRVLATLLRLLARAFAKDDRNQA
jgi:hypothetical protein